ncbi:hypothetical protein GCM10010247_04840 [Streptomyces calvus]|nr:hypothetical protein GCM10010247_04840 [Streptomyces calvus]
MHHLEREDAVQPGVHGPVDRGHPADRDPRVDAVPAVEHLPDQRVLKGRVHAGSLRSATDTAVPFTHRCSGPVTCIAQPPGRPDTAPRAGPPPRRGQARGRGGTGGRGHRARAHTRPDPGPGA